MRALHTSDWHLGRTLYGKKRYDEFENFLTWLSNILLSESIDLLLIAGDIFDTSTPSNRAQELYYKFLCRVALSGCRHVVIIGGNHDSPSFLNAPKELLKVLNVHVVGAINESIEEEVIVLRDKNRPEAIICAVPYLRDKDIRTTEPGETIEDKNAKIITGLKSHYALVCELAEKKRSKILEEFKIEIPIIGMGHLFTAGSKVVEGDGVRELYIGSLAHVDVEIFPPALDYVALGHLHVPQVVSNKDTIRYSGSPIPMGFGEANQQKIVVLVEFTDRQPTVKTVNIPCFQQLVRIQGSLDHILLELKKLKENDSDAWLEIEFTGEDIFESLSDTLNEIIANSKMEIRRIKNRRIIERLLNNISLDETLDDLDVTDIFSRCLDAYEIPGDERPELVARYEDVVKRLQEEDLQAQ
jgi:DNA repair protein SbcD/Mre11